MSSREVAVTGRKSYLDKIDGLRDLVAQLYVSGIKQDDMLAQLPISDKATLRNWLKDEGVMSRADKLIRERTLRIVRKVDSTLEARLLDDKQRGQMSTETLLKIRKELMPDIAAQAPKGATVEAVMDFLWKRSATDERVAYVLDLMNQHDPNVEGDAITVTAEEIVSGDWDEDAEEVDGDLVMRMAETPDDIEPEEGT